jgi:hypothetical protein
MCFFNLCPAEGERDGAREQVTADLGNQNPGDGRVAAIVSTYVMGMADKTVRLLSIEWIFFLFFTLKYQLSVDECREFFNQFYRTIQYPINCSENELGWLE